MKSSPHDGPDSSVHSWGITTACDYCNTLHFASYTQKTPLFANCYL
jgi:hypothetical protein